MATLSQLVGYRERLIAARYGGIRSVRDSNGEEIAYKSDAEMASALRALEQEILTAERRLSPVVYPYTCKGI